MKAVGKSGDAKNEKEKEGVDPAEEPKTKVTQYCQKKIKRPLTKADITYNTQNHGVQKFQTTVTLQCLDGVAFVGEVANNTKEAEKQAAKQVVLYFADEIKEIVGPVKQRNKTATSATADGSTAKNDAGTSPQNPYTSKAEVNDICMKIVRCHLNKDDIVFKAEEVEGGHQCTLRLKCLPGDYGDKEFTSAVSSTKKEAEENVAAQTLKILKADAEITKLLSKPKPTQSKGKGKGKGMGKGKFKGKFKGKAKDFFNMGHFAGWW